MYNTINRSWEGLEEGVRERNEEGRQRRQWEESVIHGISSHAN